LPGREPASAVPTHAHTQCTPPLHRRWSVCAGSGDANGFGALRSVVCVGAVLRVACDSGAQNGVKPIAHMLHPSATARAAMEAGWGRRDFAFMVRSYACREREDDLRGKGEVGTRTGADTKKDVYTVCGNTL